MSNVVSTARWRLDGTTARCVVDDFSAVIDLLRPSAGLHEVHVAGVALPDASLLGVQLNIAGSDELSLPETYVRGDDLVATYPQTASRPFRLQVYWRIVDSAALAGCRETMILELQVSMNTSLLDTRPFVDVASAIAGTPAKETAADRFLIRGGAASRSYFEAAHPTDAAVSTLASTSTSSAAGVRTAHRLFDRPLEKGVILRLRIRAAFVPAGDDAAAADCVWREFAASEPPLTT